MITKVSSAYCTIGKLGQLCKRGLEMSCSVIALLITGCERTYMVHFKSTEEFREDKVAFIHEHHLPPKAFMFEDVQDHLVLNLTRSFTKV